MTYMQSNLDLAGGIQELSLDEIGFISGGNGSTPPPPRPAPSVPSTTSSPVGPQIPVSRSTTVGGGTITTPYRPPAPAVRIVIKF